VPLASATAAPASGEPVALIVRADRQVDARRQHDQREARCHQEQQARLAQHVKQIARRQERIAGKRQRYGDDQHCCETGDELRDVFSRLD
jgi:hypothetical protein